MAPHTDVRAVDRAGIVTRLQDILQQSDIRHADVCWGDGSRTESFSYDQADPPESSAAVEARRYLVASLTKPVVAMAAVHLASEGACCLNERIGRFLPDFSRAAFRRIALRHLLNHSSGLPDMLPDNTELRASHADLRQFLKRASEIEPEFATGTQCRYSSVGLLILGRVIEELTEQSLPDYLQHVFFEPLHMKNSWLGLPSTQVDQLLPTVFPSLLPNWQTDAADWGWNSTYWRTLGAPWGGLISSAGDLAAFARAMLNFGQTSERRVLSAAAVKAATSDQTLEVSENNASGLGQRGWGFGWRMQWETHAASFGDFWSRSAYGHWGATGTMICIDPELHAFAVILTTTPYEESRSTIQRLANVIASRFSGTADSANDRQSVQ